MLDPRSGRVRHDGDGAAGVETERLAGTRLADDLCRDATVRLLLRVNLNVSFSAVLSGSAVGSATARCDLLNLQRRGHVKTFISRSSAMLCCEVIVFGACQKDMDVRVFRPSPRYHPGHGIVDVPRRWAKKDSGGLGRL